MNRKENLRHNNKVIIMYYLNIFLLFSIFGYSYETIFRILLNSTQDYLLFGPWMPIYGFGVLISEYLNNFLNKFQLKRFKKILIFLILNLFILTGIEEIGGILVEKIFHTSFWNYEYLPLNIGPYINVFVSLLWSISSMIIVYIILPIISKFLKRIPKFLSYLILILLVLDHIILLYQYYLR